MKTTQIKSFARRSLPAKITTRDLNESEKGLALTTTAAVHYLIRRLDNLQHTSLFSQKLKQTGKMFHAELEKHAQAQVWSGEVEGSDLNAAADQLDNIAAMLHNLIIMSFGCSDIPAGQQHLFWLEISKHFKRFDIPLRMTHDGLLEFCGKEGEVV